MWEMVVEIEILPINMIMLAIKDTGYALMFFSSKDDFFLNMMT